MLDPVFMYASKIGRIKIFSRTCLSEILRCLNNLAGSQLVVLATCNAENLILNKTIKLNTTQEDISLQKVITKSWAPINQPNMTLINGKLFMETIDKKEIEELRIYAQKKLKIDEIKGDAGTKQLILVLLRHQGVLASSEDLTMIGRSDYNGYDIIMPGSYHEISHPHAGGLT